MGGAAELPADVPWGEQKYLYQYVALFEWGCNIKRVTPQFIRAMLGIPFTTFRPHEPLGFPT